MGHDTLEVEKSSSLIFIFSPTEVSEIDLHRAKDGLRWKYREILLS